MGKGSSWRPGSARREPRSTRHNTPYESYKPDYSRYPLSKSPNKNTGPESWKPNYPKSHGPRDGPGRAQYRIQKSKPHSQRGSAKHSVNPIKNQIFQLNRQLKQDLPADIRVEKERALAGYERDLEMAIEERKKQDMISKYHMVRFFERQKATRHVKKCRKSLADCSPDNPHYQNLQQALHIAEVDLAYTQYSPLYQKYEAIYPQKKAQENNEDKPTEQPPRRPAMWKIVEKCMEQGTLDALRDGTLGDEDLVLSFTKMRPFKRQVQLPIRSFQTKNQSGRFTNKTNPPTHQAVVAGQADEMDEDSDGGFFEEAGGVKIDAP